jgi:hypothetical protein
MKRVVQHTKICMRKTNGGCPICKQLIALCCYHAKHCQVSIQEFENSYFNLTLKIQRRCLCLTVLITFPHCLSSITSLNLHWTLHWRRNYDCVGNIENTVWIVPVPSLKNTSVSLGLVVRVSGYRCRGPGFYSQCYQIFWVVVWNGVLSALWVQLRSCLEKIIAAPFYKAQNMVVVIRCADHATPSVHRNWH